MFRISGAITPLSAVLMLAACSGGGQNDMASPAPARPVAVMKIAEQPDQAVRTFAGTLRARDRSELSFDVAGVVAKLNVDIGDQFNRGDILAQIDDQLIALDLARSEADLIEARATRVEAGLDHARRVKLVATGAISKADFDAAAARLDRASARVEALVAATGSARRRLHDTRIVAPYDGEVSARHIEPSQTIQVGQPVLSVVGSDAGMEATFYLPERWRQSFTTGTAVSVHIKSTAEKLPGKITHIGSSVNTAGLYPVTAAVEGVGQSLLSPGMIVDIAAANDSRLSDLIVPHTAIVAAGPQAAAAVYLVDPVSATLHLKPVRVKRLSGAGAIVSEGLSTGDIIVTRGVDFLDHGQAVYPTGLTNGIVRFNP